MSIEKINKCDLAKQLKISRPTLDKYLQKGFPENITNKFNDSNVDEDIEYKKILLDNEIRLCEYNLNKLKILRNNLEEVK